jgi:hypothetical protein
VAGVCVFRSVDAIKENHKRQQMEVNRVQEREINKIVVEEVLMEDTDYEEEREILIYQ